MQERARDDQLRPIALGHVHREVNGDLRNSALNARNPIATTKPDTRTRNYNGWLQGPVVKGRLDFMAYAGQWQQDENAVVNATVLERTREGPQRRAAAAVHFGDTGEADRSPR